MLSFNALLEVLESKAVKYFYYSIEKIKNE